MLIDQKHRPWAIATAVISLLAVAGFVLDAPRHVHGPSGSTLLGLSFGIAALLLMLFLSALSLRRKVPHWRLGRAQTWMRGHIWGGLLVVVFVALHSAGRMGGLSTTLLWTLLVIVTVSGIVGLVIQQSVPSRLMQRVPREPVAQQLNRETSQLRQQAQDTVVQFAGSLDVPAPAWDKAAFEKQQEELKAQLEAAEKPREKKELTKQLEAGPTPPAGGEPLRRFYLEHVQGQLAENDGSDLESPQHAQMLFHTLRTMVPEHIHPGVDALESIVQRRRELLRQRFYMRLMIGWLIVHVPLSWALLVLSVAHAIVSFRWGV